MPDVVTRSHGMRGSAVSACVRCPRLRLRYPLREWVLGLRNGVWIPVLPLTCANQPCSQIPRL